MGFILLACVDNLWISGVACGGNLCGYGKLVCFVVEWLVYLIERLYYTRRGCRTNILNRGGNSRETNE